MFHCKVECQYSQVCVTVFSLPVSCRCLWQTFLRCQWWGHTYTHTHTHLRSEQLVQIRSTFFGESKPADRWLMFGHQPLAPVTSDSIPGVSFPVSYLNLKVYAERDDCILWLAHCSLTFKVWENIFSVPVEKVVNSQVFDLTAATYFRKCSYPPNRVWFDEDVLLRRGKEVTPCLMQKSNTWTLIGHRGYTSLYFSLNWDFEILGLWKCEQFYSKDFGSS